MISRIVSLAVKELIQLMRDRRMLLLILLFPVAQLVLLAGATGHGINDLALAVADQDRSDASRSLIQALDNTPDLTVRYMVVDPEAAGDLVQRAQAVAALIIPPGFGAAMDTPFLVTRDQKRGMEAGSDMRLLQLIIDGTTPTVARSAQYAVEGTVGAMVSQLRGRNTDMPAAPMVLVAVAAYNPALSSRLFTIPAQMGFIVYQVTLAVASLAFARERELGTLEGLLVTPLRRIELITGKAAVAWLAGGLDFLVMVWVVRRFFDVPLRGSFGLLLAFSLLFVGVEIAYGVILSSFARTQQQAILYVFVVAMLDIALSGYLVPVKNMPAFFGAFAQASPLQHYLVAIRAIMLKGAGLAELWPQAIGLIVIGAAMGTVAVRTAARRLE